MHILVLSSRGMSKIKLRLPISHQIGATLLTLSDQIMAFIARTKHSRIIQIPKEQAPMFQDWNICLDMEENTSMHAMKFTVGTRGNVGSIPDGRPEHGEYLRSKVEFI